MTLEKHERLARKNACEAQTQEEQDAGFWDWLNNCDYFVKIEKCPVRY